MALKRSLISVFAILACLIFAWATGAGRPYPASAGGVIDPTCTSSNPCIEYDNNGTGPGIRGVSLIGNGSNGITRVNSTSATNGREGVFGNDMSTSGSFNSGVRGLSVRGTGVSGASTNGLGVSGSSTNSYGVFGGSTHSVGVYGSGDYGTYGNGPSYGAVGIGGSVGTYGNGANVGVEGVSSSGIGVYASSSSSFALQAHTGGGVGAYVTAGNGNGGDVTGTYIGAVLRATSFPIVATDPSGNNLFYVDGSGNVFYHGSLNHFAVTRTGKTAIGYGATTSSPTVEDTGSGQLINGIAMVELDASFAQTIDPRAPYHVMITPDGDTRGLFVASKGRNGFVVREVQGGRSSLTFDYHIYATALGHAGERMVVMTRAEAAAASPRAPLLRLPSETMVPKPALRPNPRR